MENKINIAELLKDCPKGMALDCSMFENLELNHIDKDDKVYPIKCRVKTEHGSYNYHSFNKYGCYGEEKYYKCVIFPKGKTTWEGFVPPCNFKDGDIVVIKTSHNFIFYSIYQGVEDREVLTYVDYYHDGNKLMFDSTLCFIDEIVEQRFATEEEKSKLFQAIKDNGYKWNAETKTLEELIESNEDVDDKVVMSGIYFDREYYADEVELHLNNYEIEIRDGKTYAIFKNQKTETLKAKFKVGDRVVNKDGISVPILITGVGDTYYWFPTKNSIKVLPIAEQDDWELVPHKFDVTTLKPFDKVLVRNKSNEVWTANFYSHYDATSDKPFICVGWSEMNEYRYLDLKKYERIETIKDCVVYILSVIFIWISISSTICAFKNPELTRTQVLLRIPQSFILNFE